MARQVYFTGIMKVGQAYLLKDLLGEPRALFRIPVYQRNYDWTTDNCQRLLRDVHDLIGRGPNSTHFLGTLVHLNSGGGTVSGAQEYSIVDGQQRLTTVTLMLKALADLARSQGDHEQADAIMSSYIQSSSQELRLKLKQVRSDAEQFRHLMDDDVDDIDHQGRLYQNYKLCRDTLAAWQIPVQDILHALGNLVVAEIALTSGIDDPQMIFESINSTGHPLSAADLIRNYLLMDSRNQEELYDRYWLKIEQALKPGSDDTHLNQFFLQYTIFKSSAPVVEGRLYHSFTKLFPQKITSPEPVLKELKYYANIFRAFVRETNTPGAKQLKILRTLKQTTCYPFLLHLYNDFQQRSITQDTLEQCLDFLVAYLLRRTVCGIPSNSLRSLFSNLYKRIFAIESNKKNYGAALNLFLHQLQSRDKVPSDEEFRTALITANLYRNRDVCHFLLSDIENGSSKEYVDCLTLSIEHIMPQHPGDEWNHIPAKDRERYLHTLGNLTLTGYNPELSNKGFGSKKELFQPSKVRVLNKDVTAREQWNTDTILARGSRLADIIMQRFSIIRAEDDSILFEQQETIVFPHYNEVTNKKPLSFTFDGHTYPVRSFSQMYHQILLLLDARIPGLLDNMAREEYRFPCRNRHQSPQKIISTNEKALNRPTELRKGIYLEVNFSGKNIMRIIEGLLLHCHLNPASFAVTVTHKKPA